MTVRIFKSDFTKWDNALFQQKNQIKKEKKTRSSKGAITDLDTRTQIIKLLFDIIAEKYFDRIRLTANPNESWVHFFFIYYSRNNFFKPALLSRTWNKKNIIFICLKSDIIILGLLVLHEFNEPERNKSCNSGEIKGNRQETNY